MKRYIEQVKDMYNLRDYFDNTRNYLTDTLKNDYGSLDNTEVYLLKAQVELTEKYIEILDAHISHAYLKEQSEANNRWESYKMKGDE